MVDNPSAKKRVPFGTGRLASETIPIPPEREAIAGIQKSQTYEGWQAVEEANELGLLRPKIRHAELSPTFRCPEDCGGCPDRASLHVGDPPEKQIGEKEWFAIVDKMVELGVEYFMLIGGTIDGHPTTYKLMRYILSKKPPVDVGWFTDGIMLQNWKTGEPNILYEKIVQEGKMLEMTTHVSADYLGKDGTNLEGPILSPEIRWENEYGGSRFYKSAFGERLARNLIKQGARRVVINSAISAHNLDQIIPIYNYVVELHDYARKINSPTVVLYTFSPWQWRVHLARGDNPKNYSQASLLSEKHEQKLKEISEYLLENTWERIKEGKPRVAANSSGYIAGLPHHGVYQDTQCNPRSGELAAEPGGRIRIDPILVSARMLEHAVSSYGYRDRDIDKPPFSIYDEKLSGPAFSNLIQSTRGEVRWY